MRNLIYKTGKLFESIGDFFFFSIKSVLYIFKPPFRHELIIKELMIIGVESILIISVSNMAIGMIFTLQMSIELQKLNATSFVPNVLAQTLSREMCPVISTLMLIAKNGSAFTAEIGSMETNEQIHAMQTMAVNPIQYIVSPRLLACSIMFPVLTGLANLVGVAGGAIIAFGLLKLEYAFSVNYMFLRLEPADILTGIFKSFVMGIAVCLICCYKGFHAKKGSTGVGTATTQAVVISSITILLLDLILGQFYLITGIIN